MPFYAILRSIPNKLLGVIAMFSAILILLVMPFTDLSRSRGIQFKPLSKAAFFIFVANFLILMELGAKHVESPFIEFGQISTVVYFAHFLIIVPLISLLENTLIEIDSKKNVIYSVEHATVVSGWWWQYTTYTNRELFSKPFPSTLQERLKDQMRNQHFSAQGHNTYCSKLKLWVREDGMVSLDAPLPENQHGTRKPFKWTTVEQYLNDKGQSMEDLKKIMGIDGKSKYAFEEARKRYQEAIKIREEASAQRAKEDAETDEINERPGDTDLGRPIRWKDKHGNWHEPASYTRQHNENIWKEEQSSRILHDDDIPSGGSSPINSPVDQFEINNLLSLDVPNIQDIIGELYINISPWLYLIFLIFVIFITSLRIKLCMNWYENNKHLILSLPVIWLLGIKSLLYNLRKINILSLSSLLIILLSICMFFALLTLLPSYLGTSIFFFFKKHCDAPRPWGIYFQDSATPQMEGIVELHDNILFYLVIILFGVGWLLVSIVKNYANTESPISHKYLSHGTLIELIWTITPALILILIAFPSFKLLYLMDEVSDPAMAVLAEGFFTGGLKLHILNKIKDTNLTGEKNNTLVPRLAQVQSTSFLLRSPNMSITRYTKHNFTTFLTKPVSFKKTFHTKVKASNRSIPMLVQEL